MKLPIRVILTAVVASAALVACAGKNTKPPAAEAAAPAAAAQPENNGGKYTVESLDTDSCLRQRVVYFDFDKSEIKPEFQAQIACHAAYLRQFPGARVTLEGNTDERGTREYNLGLGERRGNAVDSALVAAGASASQLNVVSYGEERPVCKEHNEGCWHKNRRVEIVYTAKQ
ncbi:MAG: peptidoglycan-associated lipoprotein Pal [Xanthomonadales bacterium PRO7]|jgi:peptidoglycan-associated lipoprotein|nr:peptidoglycan-associated lipoprotein Pal [Xanthomonadales bacterium PRO7]HMM57136.1 peptidoglycan-associated lipoprotein Pal [Rudaea sp.]